MCTGRFIPTATCSLCGAFTTGVGGLRAEWVGTGRTAELCFPIPPVATVRAAFTAHGDRSVGLFSSSSDDMAPYGESTDFLGYPHF